MKVFSTSLSIRISVASLLEQKEDSKFTIHFHSDLNSKEVFTLYNNALVLDGGIAIIEMLYKSNVLALVGGGKNPKYTPNKVIIWDDYQSKVLNEFKFTSSVKNVKLKKDKIIVVCDQRIYVYHSQTYKSIDTIETFDNPKGIIGINTDLNSTVLAYPENPKGFIKIKNYEKSTEISINAHESEISFICINPSATILATTNENGSLVRIYDVQEGHFIDEYKKSKGDINYMCFDQTTSWLAVAGDSGTIQIWSMSTVYQKLREKGQVNEEDIPQDLPKNKTSVFSFLGFKNEKNFAQVKLEDEKSICGFAKDNTVIAISSLGKYYLSTIDTKKGGDCKITKEEELNKKRY